MRLFTGLDVPYEMRRNLELLLQLLKPTADIRWSPLENLHVTTKFIGEWPQPRIEELERSLKQVPRPGELKIGIRGLGWLPNPHHPRILYVGVSAPAGLADLATATDKHCSALGIQAETKPFRPHLTLARIKDSGNLFPLKKAIAELPNQDFGEYMAADFHLYESELRPGGSRYVKLSSYPLSA
jgi:RNA 2',3'-cyclic 3'-phosphodiesterase